MQLEKGTIIFEYSEPGWRTLRIEWDGYCLVFLVSNVFHRDIPWLSISKEFFFKLVKRHVT